MPKSLSDVFINAPLERHNQADRLIHPSPAPAVEFTVVAGHRNVDLVFTAGEAGRKPLLRLTAILPLPSDADEMVGQIILVPIGGFGDDLSRADRGLLAQLAERRRAGVLI